MSYPVENMLSRHATIAGRRAAVCAPPRLARALKSGAWIDKEISYGT